MSMSIVKDKIFTQKYKPNTLDDLILPDRIKSKLNKGVYNHLLLYGSPGTGKTSAAQILVNQFNLPYIYIDASTETSIDVIRSQIIDFCSTASIIDDAGKLKVVILDEIEGVSDHFFKSLRATMDRFANNSRFIATTNYINKLPDAIISRFESINFDFNKDEESDLMKKYIKRVYDVCNNESIKIERDALVELVKRKFPDLRNIMNIIQGYVYEGKSNITIEDIKKFHSIFKDVYELIFNNIDPVKNYQYMVSNYSGHVDDVLTGLGNDFIEYIKMEQPDAIKHIPQILITVAEHQAQRVNVIDEVVSMLSCIYKIQTIINQ